MVKLNNNNKKKYIYITKMEMTQNLSVKKERKDLIVTNRVKIFRK